ncbi:hypothetical protein J2R99_000731 [Rhodopseudomonas julia]|uniref:Uncharacterized protein n=1 Tax=Rhodopseudomonas julia TaxID=200617 RepID=A0ABU0C2Y9_9BRAD|nr:hypothetical protein [Rhodopseudomonas julia]
MNMHEDAGPAVCQAPKGAPGSRLGNFLEVGRILVGFGILGELRPARCFQCPVNSLIL